MDGIEGLEQVLDGGAEETVDEKAGESVEHAHVELHHCIQLKG